MVRTTRTIMASLRWAFHFGSWKPTRSEWMLAAQCVQQEEKERIAKFVFTKDGKAAMAGRLLMRKAITDSVQIAWNEIRLLRTDKGKPYLGNNVANIYPNFNFNVSHQGDFAVLATETVLQVGVDVMKVEQPSRTNVPDFFHTMRKQFTNHEWQTIKSSKDEWKQLEMFYRYWCLKESYIKAIGIGLGYDLQRIEFHVRNPELSQEEIDHDTVVYVDKKLDKTWRFQEMKLNENHIVAVALWDKTPDSDSQTQMLGTESGGIIKDGADSGDVIKNGADSGDVIKVGADSSDVIKNRAKPALFRTIDFTELMSTAKPLLPADDEYWDMFSKKSERYQPVKK